MSDEEVEGLIDLIGDALGFAYWGASQGISAAQEAPMPEDFLSEYTEATGDEDWETLSHRVPAMARSLLAERRALEERNADLAAQVATLTAERNEARRGEANLSRLLRDRVNDLAAQVAALTATIEAQASVIGETRERALEEAVEEAEHALVAWSHINEGQPYECGDFIIECLTALLTEEKP